MNKFQTILFILLFLGLILRLSLLNPLKNHQDFDYFGNTHMMQNLVINGNLNLKFPLLPSDQGWEYFYLPLAHLIARIFHTLTQIPLVLVFEILNCFLLVGTAFLSAFIVGKKFGGNYGILTALFILFGQYFLFITINGQLDIFSVFIFCGFFYIWNFSSSKKYLPLFYALLALIRYENWIFLFVLSIFYFVGGKKTHAITPIIVPATIMFFFFLVLADPLWPSTFRQFIFQRYHVDFNFLPYSLSSIDSYLDIFKQEFSAGVGMGIAETYDPIIVTSNMLIFLFKRFNIFLIFLFVSFIIYLIQRKKIFFPLILAFIAFESVLIFNSFNRQQLADTTIPQIIGGSIFVITLYFLHDKPSKIPVLAIFLLSFFIPFFTGIKTVLYDRYYLSLLVFFPYIFLEILQHFSQKKYLIIIPLIIFFLFPSDHSKDAFFISNTDRLEYNYPLIGYAESNISINFAESGYWFKENKGASKLIGYTWGQEQLMYVYSSLNPNQYLLQLYNLYIPEYLRISSDESEPVLNVVPDSENVIEFLCENNYSYYYSFYSTQLITYNILDQDWSSLVMEPTRPISSQGGGRIYKITCS